MVDDRLAAFRQEFRDWLARNLPTEWSEREFAPNWPPSDDDPDEVEISRLWQRRLFEGGWVAPGWPVEHGGRGLDLAHRVVLDSELAAARAPVPIGFSGIDTLGPALIRFGTDEQRARFLPRILSAEDLWCQGYSEPDAGSDLASLRTTAVRDGDDYVVTGQKVWTSYGGRADWCFLLVRTGSPESGRKGITFLLAEMSTPGIEWRQIRQVHGDTHFGELFLDGARVPVSQRLGEEGEGWRIATHSLAHERMMAGNGPGPVRARLDALERLARQVGCPPTVRQELARLEGRLRGLEGVAALAGSLAEQGDPRLGAWASMVKLLATEIRVSITETAGHLLGTALGAAGPDPGGRAGERHGVELWAWELLEARSGPIYAGTNEIQRNIIGELGLGLPR